VKICQPVLYFASPIAVKEVSSKHSKIARSVINFQGKILIFKEFQVLLKWHFKFKHFSRSSRTCMSHESSTSLALPSKEYSNHHFVIIFRFSHATKWCILWRLGTRHRLHVWKHPVIVTYIIKRLNWSFWLCVGE